MKMFILAGGFGSRLQSAVPDLPKALAPVGSKPFLYLQLEHWIAQGQRSFVFLLHHQAEQIIKFLNCENDGLLKGCEIAWIIEPVPLDTGGAVAYAINKLQISGDFLLTNADTWIGGGVRDISRANAPSMAVVLLGDTHRYGRVEFNSNLHVTAFIEKCADAGPGWINAGMCILNAEMFRNWDGQPFSLEGISFPELSFANQLRAVTLRVDFIDIGVPEDYFRFCRWSTSGQKGGLCS